MRKIRMAIIWITLFIMLAASGTAYAAGATLNLDKSQVNTDDTVTVSGTADPNTWITLKVLDSSGDICVFDAVVTDNLGNYSISFKAPNSPGGYNVVAGYGTNTVSQSFTAIPSEDGSGGSVSSGKSSGGTVSKDEEFIRIYGADRYETAAAISKSGWQSSDTVVLASGEDYPDALSGITLAYIMNAPVLLTERNNLNQCTLDEIQRLGAKEIIILGGTGVISREIEDYLRQKYNVERIGGSDRYSTAAAVGERLVKLASVDTAVIVSGLDFPDAAAIGPFAARRSTPVLFTGRNKLNANTEQALKNWGIKKVIIAGGTGVISSAVEDYIKNVMDVEVKRISGSDRYLTSLEIAKYYDDYYSYGGIVLATGEDFPDALCGAPFAAKGIYPVLLSGRDDINMDILNYITGLKVEKVYILGGFGAVSDGIKGKLKQYP